MVIEYTDDGHHPLEDMETTTERSRYVCLPCTREVRGLVICDGPICRRCTRIATMQRVLAPGQKVPEPQSLEERKMTEILARHKAMRRFTLPKVPQK